MPIRVIPLVAERIKKTDIIDLGRKCENEPTHLRIDCGRWADTWQDIDISIRFVRHGDEHAYTVAGTLSNGIYTYIVTDTDTAIVGNGLMELVGVSGGRIVASATAMTVVQERMNGIDDGEEPPEPVESWYTQALQAAHDAQAAAEAAYASESNAAASESSALSYSISAENSAGIIESLIERIEALEQAVAELTGGDADAD